MLRRFLKDESGQGMVEYALIIALIAVVVIAVVAGLGTSIKGVFSGSSDALNSAVTTGAGD
jgi:pilus assembly protein Flp/PilA